jgi:hypothetical protein
MSKKPAASFRRTAFVPGVVFRTVLKTAIPVFSATILPACLAIAAFDARNENPDGSSNRTLDAGEVGQDPDANEAGNEDAANAEDGQIGGSDGSGN